MNYELLYALGTAAPYYNLVFAFVALLLFIRLFRTHAKNKATLLFPWKLLFVGMLVFIIEEVLTVLRLTGILHIPVYINGFFELVIVTLFLYALLIQKEIISQVVFRVRSRSHEK